jgi:phage-related protein
MENCKKIKPLDFIGSSREDLKNFPDEIKEDIGYALFEAQQGRRPARVKPLKGFGGAGVLEILEDHRSGTYRVVYTVKFAGVIYVLHCFQKKSKHGVETPRQDMELIRRRIKAVEEDHRTYYQTGGKA